MVAFGLKYKDNVVSKWEPYYLDYPKLKVELKKRVKALHARYNRSLSSSSLAASEHEASKKTAQKNFSAAPRRVGDAAAGGLLGVSGREAEEEGGERPPPSERSLLSTISPFNRMYSVDGLASSSVPFSELLEGEMEKVDRFFNGEAQSQRERLDFHTLEDEEGAYSRRNSLDSRRNSMEDQTDDFEGASSGRVVSDAFRAGGNKPQQVATHIGVINAVRRSRSLYRDRDGEEEEEEEGQDDEGGAGSREGSVGLDVERGDRREVSFSADIGGGDDVLSASGSGPSVLKKRQSASTSHLLSKMKGPGMDGSTEGDIPTARRLSVTKRLRRVVKRVSSKDWGSEKISKEADSLKRAISEIYRDMTLLRNFATINYTACVKISKKHDKQIEKCLKECGASESEMEQSKISPKMLLKLKLMAFAECEDLEAIMHTCEKRFSYAFCGGDIEVARGMLLPQKSDETQDYSAMILGYRMGMAAILFVWVAWDCVAQSYVNGTDHSIFVLPAFYCYRAFGAILLLQWAWAVSTLYWTRARINYIYLFELDPRWTGTPVDVFNSCSKTSIFFGANMLLYFKSEIGTFPRVVPPGVYPMAMMVYALVRLVRHQKSGRDLIQAVGRLLRTPTVKVDFYVTYVADVLTSSVKTLQDLCWCVAFFLSGDVFMERWEYESLGGKWQRSFAYKSVLIPCVCIFPLALRCLQCLRRYYDTGKRKPNLLNTLKYAMAQTVSIFGVISPGAKNVGIFRLVWVALYVTSSLYSFTWDVYMDWGLGRRKFHWLAERRMLPRQWPYYCAIAMDLVLRFNWMASFIPPAINTGLLPVSLPEYITTFVIILEIFRRTVWGFFRLEHEHLGNTEGYRRVGFVPLHFTTSTDRQWARDRGTSSGIVWEISGVVGALVLVSAFSVMAANAASKATP